MLVHIGAFSLCCFLASTIPTLLLFLQFIEIHAYQFVEKWLNCILPIYFLILNIVIRVFTRDFSYRVAVRAVLLGFVFSIGVFVSVLATQSWHIFGWYMCVMSFFHYSEFLAIAMTNPQSLSISSFILNHSIEYQVAAMASWLEFFLEKWLCPELKTYKLISLVGLSFCIGGECLRKMAICTAKTNFNHVVQSVHNEGHQLITHGVYAVFRHPSYVGWFYWSLGTQLILLNPVCLIGYTLASWKFFYDRITVEEMTLVSFFGQDYINYQHQVPTGLPLIKGYEVELDRQIQTGKFQSPVT